jgi:hypothetical protein
MAFFGFSKGLFLCVSRTCRGKMNRFQFKKALGQTNAKGVLLLLLRTRSTKPRQNSAAME